MNAIEIKDALCSRWPASEYLTIEEAPQDSMRQGRKIDLLVVSLWKSRGHALDAVEIKVSMSDWKRELDNAEKADWWWAHTHRFWLACPAEMAPKVRDQLPETWGLLTVAEGAAKIVVQAPHHEPTALPWTACIGIMRAASGAGANALVRARETGRSAGYEEGKRNRESGSEALDELRALVKAAEEATGIPIARWSYEDRQGFGGYGVARDDMLAALRDLTTDRLVVKRARDELAEIALRLGRAHESVQALLAEPPREYPQETR